MKSYSPNMRWQVIWKIILKLSTGNSVFGLLFENYYGNPVNQVTFLVAFGNFKPKEMNLIGNILARKETRFKDAPGLLITQFGLFKKARTFFLSLVKLG